MKLIHHSRLGIVLAGSVLAGAALVWVVLHIYRSIRYRYKDLRKIGLFQETVKSFTDPKTKAIHEKVIKARIGIVWHRNNLVFTKYCRSFALPDFERIKPNLEHIFHCKIDEITSAKPPFYLFWRQPRIILATEAFKRQITLNDCPADLKPGEMWGGRIGLGTDIRLDTVGKFQYSVGIYSQSGGGKGNLIASLAFTLLDNWTRQKGTHPFDILFLDAKGTDYLELIQRFGAKSYNPIFLDELKKAVQLLEEYKAEVDQYRKYLAESGVSVAHWFEIPEKYPKLKAAPKPLLLIVDEATQYLAPRASVRITKESTEDEKQLKEKYDLESRLGFLINSILQLFRSSGAVVLVSTQSSRETDLVLDRTNIRTLFIGQQNAQMSRMLAGSDIAVQGDLVRGKFIYCGDGIVKKILSPLVLGQPLPKRGER